MWLVYNLIQEEISLLKKSCLIVQKPLIRNFVHHTALPTTARWQTNRILQFTDIEEIEFLQALLALVPENVQRKICICPNCFEYNKN